MRRKGGRQETGRIERIGRVSENHTKDEASVRFAAAATPASGGEGYDALMDVVAPHLAVTCFGHEVKTRVRKTKGTRR